MITKIFVLFMMVMTCLTLTTHSASAQCVVPFENGNWINMDPNTHSITHLSVSFNCNDTRNCGIDSDGNVHCPPPPPPFSVHLWGKCSPSDCDWGAVPGNPYISSDGSRWVYSFYDHGFAKRYVYIKPSALYPGYLYMWMYTDFISSARTDYVSRNWFHH